MFVQILQNILIGVKKFIDVRPNGVWQKDHVYDFTLDKSKAQKLGSCVYFVPKKNRRVQVLNDHHSYWIEDYDKMHISWRQIFYQKNLI
ncbi:MAG: hypothetical protein CM15mL5_0040 [uncultured marine virus]|nr:MAG: hypothetical protein CM15mL5_0040 [uncultured marine virus]